MSIKIFLSPSNQVANIYAYGKTNEHEQCQRIAEFAKLNLEKNYNCLCIIANKDDNMSTRANYANNNNIDIYLAIHTNAFSNSSVRGTETFYYSKDTKGAEFAKKLLADISKITEIRRRVKTYDNLIELNQPKTTRAYIEIDFHSNPERAKWIINNAELIGNTLAKSIAEFAKLTTKDNVLTESPDKKHLYRVQVGAYSVKANAEKMLTKLKEAGFTGFITEVIKN